MEGEGRRWRREGEGVEEKGKGKLKPRIIIYPLLIFSPKFLNQVYLSPVLPDGVFNLYEVWPILRVVLP